MMIVFHETLRNYGFMGNVGRIFVYFSTTFILFFMY